MALSKYRLRPIATAALCAAGLTIGATVVTGTASAAPEPDAQQVIKIGGVWKANATYFEPTNLLCTQAFHATQGARSAAELGAYRATDSGGDENRLCVKIPPAMEGRTLNLRSYFVASTGAVTWYPFTDRVVI